MTKKVAVFNDLSGFGRCSLTAALPVLSALGIQCNPIPTVVLTGQGGYPVRFSQDMSRLLPSYKKAWTANNVSFDGIYTGYVTGSNQIEDIMDFLDEFRKEDTFLLVDPVMGDNGRTYCIFSEELLLAMKELSRRANLITPNLTEACLLSDTPLEAVFSCDEVSHLDKAAQIARQLSVYAHVPQDVIITGVKVKEKGTEFVYNVALTEDGVHYFSSLCFPKSFSGTGDLFASSMCGLKMNGHSTTEALSITEKFIYHSISDTMIENTDPNDGVCFEKHLGELIPYVK